MSVIVLLVLLVALGAGAWLVNTKIPINATIKLLINIVIVAVAILLVLSAFGVWDEVRNIKVPEL